MEGLMLDTTPTLTPTPMSCHITWVVSDRQL